MEFMEEYSGFFIHQTEKAICFVPDDRVKYVEKSDEPQWADTDCVWLPKSQVRYDEDKEWEKGDMIEIEIPAWLVKEKEL